MPVYPGVTQVVYRDVPVTAPVGPRLRPGATLHYKTRIKTWSNISFLLSLSHNSYDTNWTAQAIYELLEES